MTFAPLAKFFTKYWNTIVTIFTSCKSPSPETMMIPSHSGSEISLISSRAWFWRSVQKNKRKCTMYKMPKRFWPERRFWCVSYKCDLEFSIIWVWIIQVQVYTWCNVYWIICIVYTCLNEVVADIGFSYHGKYVRLTPLHCLTPSTVWIDQQQQSTGTRQHAFAEFWLKRKKPEIKTYCKINKYTLWWWICNLCFKRTDRKQILKSKKCPSIPYLHSQAIFI